MQNQNDLLPNTSSPTLDLIFELLDECSKSIDNQIEIKYQMDELKKSLTKLTQDRDNQKLSPNSKYKWLYKTNKIDGKDKCYLISSDLFRSELYSIIFIEFENIKNAPTYKLSKKDKTEKNKLIFHAKELKKSIKKLTFKNNKVLSENDYIELINTQVSGRNLYLADSILFLKILSKLETNKGIDYLDFQQLQISSMKKGSLLHEQVRFLSTKLTPLFVTYSGSPNHKTVNTIINCLLSKEIEQKMIEGLWADEVNRQN